MNLSYIKQHIQYILFFIFVGLGCQPMETDCCIPKAPDVTGSLLSVAHHDEDADQDLCIASSSLQEQDICPIIFKTIRSILQTAREDGPWQEELKQYAAHNVTIHGNHPSVAAILLETKKLLSILQIAKSRTANLLRFQGDLFRSCPAKAHGSFTRFYTKRG